ncbi:uncharacterized protein FFNC_14618 [Fusarium fujikuroi]|nr:uncharacterized protein FFNC_14618 [Fusarium fujikuroi]
MPAARRPRSDPDEVYLTEDLDMIPLIDLFINRDDHADLRDMAMEIGSAWERTDDASRVTTEDLWLQDP